MTRLPRNDGKNAHCTYTSFVRSFNEVRYSLVWVVVFVCAIP
ncbi:hypothetical protein [Rubritalea tangerina]